MAAPAYRSHTTASINNATLTINKPFGTASGDVLIAHIHHVTGNQSIDPTPPSGSWTLIGSRQANSSSTQWWFWAAAGGSEPVSYDWTGLPSGFQEGSITAVSGADTTTPFHQTHQLQNTSISGTSVALTVTTTIADCLLWASASIDAGEATTFTQASMTERWDESLLSTFLCHAGYTEDALTAGTYDRTISYSPAQRCAGTLLAIAPGTAATDLVVQNATQAQSAGNLALTQTHVLSVGGVLQAQTAGNVTLTQVHNLAVAGATQAQAAASPSLTQVHNLTVAGAVHAQTAENITVNSATNLAVASAAQAQTAQQVTLTQTHNLTVQGATHGQAAGNVALTQIHELAVQAATQAQTAESPTLTQTHVLTVQGGTQAQASSTITLTTAGAYASALTTTAVVRSMPGTATVRASPTNATARATGGAATVRSPA
jgi:hypothetical protein